MKERADHELVVPLIQLIRTETLEAAITEANDTRFDLARAPKNDSPSHTWLGLTQRVI